jgi:energy-coupling factor transporter ATP-binding protein EcfA2
VSSFTFDDLLVWSEKLPAWQRDVLRRVLVSNLTQSDITELASIAKSSQGLSVAGAPLPVPATSEHIRSSGASTAPVALLGLRDITYVNALASGPITFGPDGLTVVYGDNASGKSGIARILKKAGRARNPGRRILPNIFDPEPGKPASASVDFRVGTAEGSFAWLDGAASDDELSRINVFDASCATVQVEKSNELTYVPEILQVFQDLAEGCRAVATELKTEKEALEKTRAPDIGILSLQPDTAAGLLVANISPATNLTDIDTICNVSDADRERLATLTRVLQNNPTRQADLLEARARRLRDFGALTSTLERALSEDTVQKFEAHLSNANATAEAAKAATQVFAANSGLAGLGAAAWKQLWESARRYSETLAYPTEPFPVIREDALCVLCQQPIVVTAASRLRGFEQFIQDDVQQRAQKALAEVQTVKTQLELLKIPASQMLLRETALRGTPVGDSTKAFIVAAKVRRRYALRRASGRNATRLCDLPSVPDISGPTALLAEEIQQLRAAAQADERRNMQRELAELGDRVKLSPLKDILHGEVQRLSQIALIDRARNDCDTARITRKGGEAAQIVVTARLRSAFASNLAQLGFTAAPVELKLGLGSIGHHPYNLSLIAREDVAASEVLSEGEKMCVALAGFLAELETTNNGSGIILDDPVSSLDHHYRLRVARQLVAAAKGRQVVVFTHDIVFLLMLTKYARKAGVPLRESSLRRGSPRHGVPEEGPPWVAMPVGKRIGFLRKELQAAAAILRSGDRTTYEQKTEWIYDRLRQSWERAVEEVLLNEVVVRFGDGVATQRLKALTDITDSDVQCVDSEMSYCSSFVHDEAGAVNSGVPDPPVVESDIKRLEDWVASVRKRRK